MSERINSKMLYRLFLPGSTKFDSWYQHICVIQYPAKTNEKTSGILKNDEPLKPYTIFKSTQSGLTIVNDIKSLPQGGFFILQESPVIF